ncbi:MAG: hypothetical protein JXJ04_10395 [Spirochaetales bacterium]|nr:hypothetical protein [Spirochaetales bacterium]
MKTIRLLVLTPPQDIELKIQSLRSRIFSESGFSSALALPVMIPLCFLHDAVPENALRKSLSAHRFPEDHITALKPTHNSGALFLGIDGGNILTILKDQCRKLIQPLSGRQKPEETNEPFILFPFYPGFFLAQNEEGAGECESLCNMPGIEILKFHHFYISFLIIKIYSGIDTWWKNIEWEIPFLVKSKN